MATVLSVLNRGLASPEYAAFVAKLRAAHKLPGGFTSYGQR
ncbi:hypothetical protein FRUB_01958 [Fimbriiglobus ruber]|uniref:HPt domain-containing protein n=1 Tax=Fimbriiglobus ruber TaxID=1908690 RepID=A0A225EB56_9BACT|nr:hypothetical protein FRUB_01958 [Fimbriiglobus ruber]